VSGLSSRRTIGHLHVDPLSFDGALLAIGRLVEGGRGGAVFTPNVDHVVVAEHDRRFRRAYARADLCLADGTVLVWAARLLGQPLPCKVSGSDIIAPLMRQAAARGWRVYLLGGGDGIAERAAARLQGDIPGLHVAGVASPRVDMREPEAARREILESIRDSGAQLVLVGLGAPKQELLIDELAVRARSTVFLGIGGGLDFTAGAVRRAPAWVSAIGLEWSYRLSREPGRLWRRYLLHDPEFLLIVLRQGLRLVAGSGDRARRHLFGSNER
jgi:N-acetylglucosaminyldiphosphoundecaprenol N-acetyl-beta-D-mannosaminyltransferase